MKLVRNPLAKLRVKAGFPHAQDAATELGCSASWLLNVERGANVPSMNLINEMARVYRLPRKKVVAALQLGRQSLMAHLSDA